MTWLVAVALAASPIAVQHQGSLKDALKVIAEKGGLNLVVAGDLSEPVDVHLTELSAEEALDSVAKVYALDVQKQGKLWVVRRAAAPPAAVAAPAAAPVTPPVPAVAVTPPPPVPAPPPLPSAEELDAEVEAAQERAEAVKEHAEALKEHARELAAAAKDEAKAIKNAAKAAKDAAKQAQGVVATGPVTVPAGQTVESAVSYGGTVTVGPGARVTDDAVAFGGDVIVEDGATVDGDAVAMGGKVVVKDGAAVHGQRVAFDGRGLGSMMSLPALKVNDEHVVTHPDELPGSGFSLAGLLLKFAVLFGLGFLLMLFAPQRMKTLEGALKQELGKNAVAGMVGFVAAIPLSVVLCLTLVLIPAVVVLWGLVVPLALLMGSVALANVLGAALPVARGRKTQAIALALGLMVLVLLSAIPVVGPLSMFFVFLASAGAIIRTRFGAPRRGLPVPDPAFVVPA